MGGIGKSVLAAAFARTIKTRRAFANGIVWLTSGQEATKLDLLNNIKHVGLFFEDDVAHYVDEVSARAHLPRLLADKVCLIVLDDVWFPEQVQPFVNALGPRCRLLITTRDGGLVTDFGAQEHPVDVLGDEEALILLADWSQEGREALPADARSVSEECGNLPFALALSGAMVRDGIPWSDVSEALRDADLTFVERTLPNYPYANVLRALKVSVDMLGREDPGAVRHELAVFPPDIPVSEDAVLTLWCRDKTFKERDARKLLAKLDRKALLRLNGTIPDRNVSLHDLQNDYIRAVSSNILTSLHVILAEPEAVYGHGATNGQGTAERTSGRSDRHFFLRSTHEPFPSPRGTQGHPLTAHRARSGFALDGHDNLPELPTLLEIAVHIRHFVESEGGITFPDYASSSAMVTIPSACESAIQVRHACSLRASTTRPSDLERGYGRRMVPLQKSQQTDFKQLFDVRNWLRMVRNQVTFSPGG